MTVYQYQDVLHLQPAQVGRHGRIAKGFHRQETTLLALHVLVVLEVSLGLSLEDAQRRTRIHGPRLGTVYPQGPCRGAVVQNLHHERTESALPQDRLCGSSASLHPHLRIDRDGRQHPRVEQLLNRLGIPRLCGSLQTRQLHSWQGSPEKIEGPCQTQDVGTQGLSLHLDDWQIGPAGSRRNNEEQQEADAGVHETIIPEITPQSTLSLRWPI